jgi:UDP-N-acetylmuramoyl-L-alanyl-D-glutamate--2,6-diaminopimelate ligase
MGRTAMEASDFTVITSDNPRTENPERIVEDILEGVPSSAVRDKDYTVSINREEAIGFAIRIAQPGDFVMIAGKGHEDYQILGTQKIHFDDREIAAKALRRKLKGD